MDSFIPHVAYLFKSQWKRITKLYKDLNPPYKDVFFYMKRRFE